MVIYVDCHKSGVTYRAEVAGEVGEHAVHELMGIGQVFFWFVGWLP